MRLFHGRMVALALVSCALTASAQISISHEDLAGPGYTFNSHQMSWGAEFDVGDAGADGVWTFGEYAWDAHVVTHILSPEATPYHDSFPTATRAIGVIDDNSYTYEEVNQDACLMLGSAYPEFVQLFDNPVLILSLPVSYQSTWNSVMSVSQELEPGMIMMMTDSGHVLVDAWGTVTTPFGEQDVLRIFTHHFMRTYMNGELISESQYLSYAWVNHDGIAVVNVDSDLDVVDPHFDYGMIEMNEMAYPVSPGPHSLPSSVSVGVNYPNPFNATTTLPLDIHRAGNVELSVYDATGRLVLTRSMFLPTGRHDIAVDGAGWASGNYFARVSAMDRVVTQRMLLIK